MNKKLTTIVTSSCILLSYGLPFAYAVEWTAPPTGAPPSSADAAHELQCPGEGASVVVTESIPGACCTDANTGTDVDKRTFKCKVGDGFSSVQALLGGLIKYATFITGLIGVLMIVVSGIQYSLSGGDGDMKVKAKGRIAQLIGGLVLLFLMGFILNSVAPWVYK